MTGDRESVLRLLPWTGPEGRPCYLVGDGTGRLSRVADSVERVRLGMAGELLLHHAADLLADSRATSVQLRFPAARLAEALRDVHRIAESRGVRLRVPEYDDPDDPAQGDV
ncbi:hypothetical protein [Streptomyces sp. NPDC051636]|uniref:hypothetical protein n=1 Tax=Streptomyces sp. NPDC051636 TaxID=3365663 RepID=UPI0037B6B1E2